MMLSIWNIDLKSKRSHLTMINVFKPSITGGLTFSKSTAIYQHILALVLTFNSQYKMINVEAKQPKSSLLNK